MANDKDASAKQEKSGTGKVEPRFIFLSHTHADRQLAAALRNLVEEAFSGVVKAFISSDPTPTGGIAPGSEWYSEIHAQLRLAEAVWVLATRSSIERPWIYWEAGVGKASCPGGVVVLRVGVDSGGVPSPLGNFQSYDGLISGDGGIGDLLGKVGNQIGMSVSPFLIDALSENWVRAAKAHKPEADEGVPSPKLSPEQLDQFGALIARLEAATDLVRTTPSRPAAPTPARRERGTEIQREFEERRARITGRTRNMYSKATELVETVDSFAPETTFRFTSIDDEGDAEIEAERDGEQTTIWLEGRALEALEETAGVSAASRSLIREILQARDQEQEEQ